MKSLYHFFRLIRPLNLLVIGVTMGVFQYYLHQQEVSIYKQYLIQPTPNGSIDSIIFGMEKSLINLDFLLLVLSTILIAAAGNIINDYFDVKADRINKPDKVIVGVHIKRRWAIIFNWSLNSIAFLLSLYLSWKYQNIWLIAIPFVSINLLWFYSMYYKRKFLIGNILVAALTGIIPYYVYQFHGFSGNTFLDLGIETLSFGIIIYSLFAFMLNFIREIIKDIADVRGDLRLNSRTLPIILGIKKTKTILIFLFSITILCLGIIIYALMLNKAVDVQPAHTINFTGYTKVNILLSGTIISLVLSLIMLLQSNKRKKYLLSSNFLKLAMLFGLLSPLFL